MGLIDIGTRLFLLQINLFLNFKQRKDKCSKSKIRNNLDMSLYLSATRCSFFLILLQQEKIGESIGWLNGGNKVQKIKASREQYPSQRISKPSTTLEKPICLHSSPSYLLLIFNFEMLCLSPNISKNILVENLNLQAVSTTYIDQIKCLII